MRNYLLGVALAFVIACGYLGTGGRPNQAAIHGRDGPEHL